MLQLIKHVPLVEINPIEGILNNVCSTNNLCKLAYKNKIRTICAYFYTDRNVDQLILWAQVKEFVK